MSINDAETEDLIDNDNTSEMEVYEPVSKPANSFRMTPVGEVLKVRQINSASITEENFEQNTL
jgi:hypothetical protein